MLLETGGLTWTGLLGLKTWCVFFGFGPGEVNKKQRQPGPVIDDMYVYMFIYILYVYLNLFVLNYIEIVIF